MLLNCINIPERKDRYEHFINQTRSQKPICEAIIWDGIVDFDARKNISLSHKKIVQNAKDSKIKMVAICEDDILFTSEKSYKYFIDNIPDGTWDILLGGLSGGFINEHNEVSNFSGLFFYCVHERFYDIFLSADETLNLDRALGTHKAVEEIEKKLGRKPVYKVCNPLVAKTINGYSNNHGKAMIYDEYWKPYKYLNDEV